MLNKLIILLALTAISPLASELDGIKRLMEGNQRYANDQLKHPNRTSERREAVASLQEPFAVIVSCSDSRVAPEIIFDQGVGDLFVVRVAGNVIGPLDLESIKYSTVYLHSSVILVLGHENCGAVKAVIKGTTEDIEGIAKLIKPSVKEERELNPSDLLVSSIKANAVNMKNFLVATQTIQKYIKDEKVEVYAGYYNLQTGLIELLPD